MSNASAREKVVIQSYGPEFAGEYAGWMNIEEYADNSGVRGDIVYAKISGAGAEVHAVPLSTGELGLPSSSGFMSPVSLQFSTAKNIEQNGKWGPELRAIQAPGAHWGRWTQQDTFGDRIHPPIAPEVGTWAIGDREILKAIKEQMQAKDIGWFYANVYHMLAYIAEEEDILADPEMYSETAIQLSAVTSHITTLEDIDSADTIMQRDLTIFGGLSPKQVPEAFKQSRQRVRESEKTIETLSKIITLSSLLPGIGYRPSGRSWPYMDASTDDENRAFGRELAALQNKDVSPAMHELRRELSEVEGRLEVADLVRQRLGILATKELAANINVA